MIVRDPSRGIGPKEALNIYISSVVWGYEDCGQNWRWFSQSTSLLPPSKYTNCNTESSRNQRTEGLQGESDQSEGSQSLKNNCQRSQRQSTNNESYSHQNRSSCKVFHEVISYYSYIEKSTVKLPEDRKILRDITSKFTENEGSSFRNIFEKYIHFLNESDEKIILPAVYELCSWLINSNREFAIVIRSYGMDRQMVLEELNSWLSLNDRRHREIPVVSTEGKIIRTSSEIGLILPFEFEQILQDGEKTTLGRQGQKLMQSPTEIYEILSSLKGVCSIRDDFEFWFNSGYRNSASKPLWVDLSHTEKVHHVFFDDNHRLGFEDDIINLLVKESPEENFRSLDVIATKKYEGVFLAQTDLFQALQDKDYYIKTITEMEEKSKTINDRNLCDSTER